MRSKKKTIALCREYFDYWVRVLGLRWWKVNVCYDYCRKQYKNDDGEEVLARTFVKWKYLTADIYVNVKGVRRLTDEEIEQMVIHECTHVLVNEMREDGIDHEERVCTTLAKAFEWVRDIEREKADERQRI